MNEGRVLSNPHPDPYLNIDAGTMSPREHGEVFVLDDGGEVDLDLGNYERYLKITLTRENNITTGKMYQCVIERERKGEYLGKTVQIVRDDPLNLPSFSAVSSRVFEVVARHSLETDPLELQVDLGNQFRDSSGGTGVERVVFHCFCTSIASNVLAFEYHRRGSWAKTNHEKNCNIFV